jgi:hypothetical protein
MGDISLPNKAAPSIGNSMKNILILILISLFFIQSKADVGVESTCYEMETPSKSSSKQPVFFRLRFYTEETTQIYIGAIVNYNNSKQIIHAVFYDETEDIAPSLGGLQRTWLEVVGGKISGKYVEHVNYEGNLAGRYVIYTRLRDNRSTLFRAATGDMPCTDNLQ